MLLSPEQARQALSRVDPARLLAGWPVGLRDGALLALLAAGLNAEEISELHASAISMDRGNLIVAVRRYGITWRAEMPIDLGGRLLAWLTERRLWATDTPVFTGPQGPLSYFAVYKVLERYGNRQPAPRRRA
ncbi:MAG TPA: hypothetical protein VF756_21640 [Thermoanaerobaculia bacterium]